MSILLFVIVLVALIVVHEFGHFIVAKRSGIRVDEFGVFFGPTLLKKRFGETDYTVNLWPIGGFVRIFGEDPDDAVKQSADYERSFVAKPKYVQAAVLVAGVSFNVLAAWLLFATAFMLGVPANVTEEHARYITDESLTVAVVVPDSPAGVAGLQSGDSIIELSRGTETLTELTPDAAATFINQSADQALTLKYERDGVVMTTEVSPETNVVVDEPERAAIGISMGLIGTLTLPLHLALMEGLTHTLNMLGLITVGIVQFFADALTLQADFSQVAGPVGIVSLVGNAAELGLVSLLTFTAFISLHLAVINLLPIPALDGGRLLFVIIEALKGSPIRPATANAVNAAGFVFLILLMLVVTWNDVARLLG